MYSPREAIEPGFLDEVVAPAEVRARGRALAEGLAELDQRAHETTKLRVREGALKAIREAIETELTAEALNLGQL